MYTVHGTCNFNTYLYCSSIAQIFLLDFVKKSERNTAEIKAWTDFHIFTGVAPEILGGGALRQIIGDTKSHQTGESCSYV